MSEEALAEIYQNAKNQIRNTDEWEVVSEISAEEQPLQKNKDGERYKAFVNFAQKLEETHKEEVTKTKHHEWKTILKGLHQIQKIILPWQLKAKRHESKGGKQEMQLIEKYEEFNNNFVSGTPNERESVKVLPKKVTLEHKRKRAKSLSKVKPYDIVKSNLFWDEMRTLYPEQSSQIQAFMEKTRSKRRNCSLLIPVFEEKKKVVGPWEESWEEIATDIQEDAIFGKFDSYKLRPCILKGGDDLRQEVMAMQIIRKFQEVTFFKKIFESAGLKLLIRPYEIMVTSASSGILEFLSNTLSIDSLKKKMPNKTLFQIYKEVFQDEFEEAQKNFVQSLAGYSLLCYLMQIKDRHNGNILIDNKGFLLHIDFGFILSISPGGMNFESAPFKLTNVEELISGIYGTSSWRNF